MEVLLVNYVFSRSFVVSSGVSKAMFICFLFPIFLTAEYIAPPILSNSTVFPAWNVPSENCIRRYKIYVDVSIYSLTGNPEIRATSQKITFFNIDKFGRYPHVEADSKREKFGAIPQLGNINTHLEKAQKDIVHYLPRDALGLAIISWETWNPLWIRNILNNYVYRVKSIQLVKQKNPQLGDTEAEAVAKEEFEQAAREFMVRTLQLGRRLRPNNFWGFFHFPDCYNHNYHNNKNYTGSCPEIDKQRNNDLIWLWNESTALYPDLYLTTDLKENPKAALFSRNRVNEAIRISKVSNSSNPLPVFVYVRPVFIDKITEYLSEIDLVNTIGETYALGASGIVIWGSFKISHSMIACKNLKAFQTQTLSRYIINVTLAAKMCHQALCQDQGLCTRKNWNSNDYLHLNPRNFFIEFAYCNKFTIYGEPSFEDLKQFSDKFDCTCFTNVTCKKNNIQNVKNIRVCVNEEICISAFVSPEHNLIPTGRTRKTTKTTITKPYTVF
ncbi:hyaluronidase PH-20-like [Sorex fumeus]|uniref:hyaluronidase PH-20-like n=1 Tax=Sorex fumeus TaxID=62283 RepID=UPI0024AD8B4D|nr:hyaluronidase PH-20-like [Sorex fumeus]XP_055974442.1 hyaluronidase PH-20-like [Sorex fumeus]